MRKCPIKVRSPLVKKYLILKKVKIIKTIDKNINDITKLIFKRSLLDAKIKYISKKNLRKNNK